MGRRQIIIIVAPAACGILLLVTSFVDLYLFEQGTISPRQAVGHELIFLFLGYLSLIVQFLAVLVWLWRRQWKPVFLSIASAVTFWVLFIVAGVNGAAFLNAA